MWQGLISIYPRVFMRAMLRLAVAAVMLSGVLVVAFDLLYWWVDRAGLHSSYVAATLPDGSMGERLDGLSDLLMFSISTFFHTGYGPYLPHGLDKVIASIEMGAGWLGQMVLLLWALVYLLPNADGMLGPNEDRPGIAILTAGRIRRR
jgi:hypothetical protein